MPVAIVAARAGSATASIGLLLGLAAAILGRGDAMGSVSGRAAGHERQDLSRCGREGDGSLIVAEAQGRGKGVGASREEPTYAFFPPVYYYRGRVREALKTDKFVESYNAYLNIRGKSTEDPLIAEVRKRAGA